MFDNNFCQFSTLCLHEFEACADYCSKCRFYAKIIISYYEIDSAMEKTTHDTFITIYDPSVGEVANLGHCTRQSIFYRVQHTIAFNPLETWCQFIEPVIMTRNVPRRV